MNAKSGNLFDPMGTITQGEFADALLLAHGWSAFPDNAKEAKEKFINRKQEPVMDSCFLLYNPFLISEDNRLIYTILIVHLNILNYN